jgi:hypothetical protein
MRYAWIYILMAVYFSIILVCIDQTLNNRGLSINESYLRLVYRIVDILFLVFHDGKDNSDLCAFFTQRMN